MTKSSSWCRGEGEGDSLCLPLEDGKGDLKDAGGARNGLMEGLAAAVRRGVDEDDAEDDEPNEGANQVAGLFNFARGILMACVEMLVWYESEVDRMGDCGGAVIVGDKVSTIGW